MGWKMPDIRLPAPRLSAAELVDTASARLRAELGYEETEARHVSLLVLTSMLPLIERFLKDVREGLNAKSD